MRRTDIDLLKGIAILSVIFYHFGFWTYGYLGVDLFFVINGFLITCGLIRKVTESNLSYIDFIVKRFCRLYPLVILAGLVSMVVGAVSMLPDNYENVAMSVVASNLFSNNILAAITTKNYWDVVNNYKPLMHMWYLGIIAEFYIIYPLLFVIPLKLFKNSDKTKVLKIIFGLVSACALISFALYITPAIGKNPKFYYIPYRFYELAFGGIIAFVCMLMKKTTLKKGLSITAFILLLALMFINFSFINDSFRLILVVLVACVAIWAKSEHMETEGKCKAFNVLGVLGKKSYSYFVWHQVILAFWRCYIAPPELNVLSVLACLVLIIIISELSYYFIENKIKSGKKLFFGCIICALILCMISGIVYMRAGVIRNVPELGINVDSFQRKMHGVYCDRIYEYDKEYEENDKLNVFVTGNSFARDWANILLESSYADRINISYAYVYGEKYDSRVLQSDYVFVFSSDEKLYDYLTGLAGEDKVWGIGTKNFGESNDAIYIRRFRDDYFSTTITPTKDILELNEEMSGIYGEKYIDMIAPIMNEKGEVPVFTDDNKFISQDCRHLTQYGARFYADKIDLDKIFNQ